MPNSRKSRVYNIKKKTKALHYAQVVIQCNMLGIVTELLHYAQVVIQCNMLGIFTELEAIKANNNGKLPYGAITNMVKAQKVYLPWFTKKSRLLVTKGRC